MAYLGPLVAALCMACSLTSLFAYRLHFSAHTSSIAQTLPTAGFIILAYVAMLIARYLSVGLRQRRVIDVVAAAISLVGVYCFVEGFQPRTEADMFGLTFVVIPAFQLVAALGLLGWVAWPWITGAGTRPNTSLARTRAR